MNSLVAVRRRAAMTLVELLTVVVIIGMLASLVLFALGTAQQAARVAKTKTMINKLDRLIMERWTSYLTRRIAGSGYEYELDMSGVSQTPQQIGIGRLQKLRFLQTLEMPDRWGEIYPWSLGATSMDNYYLPENFRSALYGAHQAAYQNASTYLNSMAASDFQARYGMPSNAQNIFAVILSNQGAETLYSIIVNGCADGGALEHFAASDVGDVDGDTLPEFLDGWGKPIAWIRWPAAISSEKQRNNPGGMHVALDHDPFDPNFFDTNAYRIVPFIYSAGPDGDLDVLSPVTSDMGHPYGYTYYDNPQMATSWSSILNPYTTVASGEKMGATTLDLDGDGLFESSDNIHNHLLDKSQ